MKISEAVRKDFEFFRDTHLDMVGHEVGITNTSDPSGYSALECWNARDSLGKILPCREAEVLAKAVRGKASWNLQIKMWAETLADNMPLLRQRELNEWCVGRPRWVFEATVRQAAKMFLAREGWSARFTRYETVMKQWWPPDMDGWCPVI